MSVKLSSKGILPVLDVAGLLAVYMIAYKLRFGAWPSPFAESLWLLILVALVIMYIMGAYHIENNPNPQGFGLEAFVAVIVIGMASAVMVYILGVEMFKPIFGRGILPVALIIFSIWAPLTRWVYAKWYIEAHGIIHWLIISGESTYQKFIADNNSGERDDLAKPKIAWLDPSGDIEQIADWLRDHPHRSGVIFEKSAMLDSALLVELASVDSVSALTITEYYEQYRTRLPVEKIEQNWLQPGGRNLLHDTTGIRIKRVFDFVAAIILLAVLFPCMFLIGFLIYVTSRGSVIYKQQRVGLNEKVFTLYKFRSMVVDAEQSGVQWSGVDDPRITKIGKIIRSTRIDELPQLWNLVLGNMSLIGPRPERPEFVSSLKEQIPYYQMRHVVPPGITGWAQVNYPYGSSVEDAKHKLEYDLYYVKNHSVKLDITIIMKTILVVIKGLGR